MPFRQAIETRLLFLLGFKVRREPGVPRGKEKKRLFCKVDSGVRSKGLRQTGN
jgi:hypothetical protein